MKPEEVSAIASAIDVPVYVMTVVSPLDHPGGPDAVGEMVRMRRTAPLRMLAQMDRRRPVRDERARARERRGAPDRGRAAAPVRASRSTRRPAAGWHPLDVKSERIVI